MKNPETKKIIINILVLTALIVVGLVGYSSFSQKKYTPVTNQINKTGTSVPTTKQVMMSVTPPAKPVFSGKQTITVTKAGFDPQTITIKAGTLITWVNKSGGDVIIASDPHPTHTTYSPLNLGRFAEGFGVSSIFDKTGTYAYHNHLISQQKGTVIVE